MQYIQNKFIYYMELLHKPFSCDITKSLIFRRIWL